MAPPTLASRPRRPVARALATAFALAFGLLTCATVSAQEDDEPAPDDAAAPEATGEPAEETTDDTVDDIQDTDDAEVEVEVEVTEEEVGSADESVDEDAIRLMPTEDAPPVDSVEPATPAPADPGAGQAYAYGGAFRDDVTAVDDTFTGLEIAGFSLLGVGLATAATGGLVWTEVDEIAGQSTLISGAALSLTGITLIYVSAHLTDEVPVEPVDDEADEIEATPTVSMTPDGQGGAIGVVGRW